MINFLPSKSLNLNLITRVSIFKNCRVNIRKII